MDKKKLDKKNLLKKKIERFAKRMGLQVDFMSDGFSGQLQYSCSGMRSADEIETFHIDRHKICAILREGD